MAKNPPANAGDAGDAGSTPGSGKPLEVGTATHSSILAWRIPWTEAWWAMVHESESESEVVSDSFRPHGL